MTAPRIPMPNDNYGRDRTVLASCYHLDDENELSVWVMLLRKAPPFYEVVLVVWDGHGWHADVGTSRFYRNIVNAAQGYLDETGCV